MKKITLLMLIVFTITSQGQNKLLSSITQYHNGSSWDNNYAYNYEYDGNNNLIAETYLNWDNGVWKIRDKTTYTYNANNKVTQELSQEWNTTTNAMENSYRDTYTYTSGNLTGQVAELWENSNWVNEWKNDITYTNNLPQSALFYNWVGSQWVLDSRETLTYNGNNKISTFVSEDWVSSQWVNSEKSLLAYDGNNKILNIRYAEWDDFNSQWGGVTDRTDYVLDATGNRSSEIDTDIIANTKDKQEGNYDTSSLMSNFAHPFKDKSGMDYLFEDFPFVNKILSTNQYSFDTPTNSYKDSNRTTYNYNSAITLSTAKPEIAITTITIFPNPTTSIVNLTISNAVTIDKVIVVDVTGKTVLQQNQNTTQVNVEKLAAGLYIIEAFSGNDKFTSKFVKQ